VSPNVGKMKLHKVLFIDKMKCAARSGVHSITGNALERMPGCVRSFDVRSTINSCTFDHVHCVRPYCV
jgi:hypothetical protein